jgi:hypothetical protein
MRSLCCLDVYPLFIVTRQRLGKHLPAEHNNRRIVGRIAFCAVHVVSEKSRRLVIPILYSFPLKCR